MSEILWYSYDKLLDIYQSRIRLQTMKKPTILLVMMFCEYAHISGLLIRFWCYCMLVSMDKIWSRKANLRLDAPKVFQTKVVAYTHASQITFHYKVKWLDVASMRAIMLSIFGITIHAILHCTWLPAICILINKAQFCSHGLVWQETLSAFHESTSANKTFILYWWSQTIWTSNYLSRRPN